MHSSNKPLVWKRYIDDIFSLSNIDLGLFLELANNYHSTIKFTAEISDTENFSGYICLHGRKIQERIYS